MQLQLQSNSVSSGIGRLFWYSLAVFLLVAGGLIVMYRWSTARQVVPTPEIILYDWDGDMPQSVLDDFEREYGIRTRYEVYESQEDAIENLRQGQVYDVVVMESRFIPMLVQENLLARYNYSNLPNHKYISPAFRDLVYDPGNLYSLPYSWGATALVVRQDLVSQSIDSWNDLWSPELENRKAIWLGQPREVLGLTLKSLGYSCNSEDPAELEAAYQQLIKLKPHLQYLEDFGLETAAPALASGKVAIAMGYAEDFLASQEAGLDVKFIYPKEGALLWGDTFVVPAASARKELAEKFLNFVMRPDINARISTENRYATSNDTALARVAAEVANNPAIYPPADVLQHAEIVLPLSAEGQKLYDDTWARFLAYCQ